MSIDDITFPGARRAQTRSVIVDALDTRPVQPRRLRTPAIVAIVVAAVAVPAGAATAYYAFRTVDDTSTIRCFTAANLDGHATYLSGTVEFPDPIAACSDLWSIGVLRAGVNDAQPPTPGANLPVPRLQACVIEYGDTEVVAVVPGDVSVCAELGLHRWAR